LPALRRGAARGPPVARVARGLGRLLPPLAPRESVGDHAAARAPGTRRLPAPPAGRAERCGPSSAGEDPLSRPRARRRGASAARLEPGAGQADAGAARIRRARGAGGVRTRLLSVEDRRAGPTVARLPARADAPAERASLPGVGRDRGRRDRGRGAPPPPRTVGDGRLRLLRARPGTRARLRADRAADRGRPLQLPRLPA